MPPPTRYRCTVFMDDHRAGILGVSFAIEFPQVPKTNPMSKAIHAADYLESPKKYPPGPVCVAFGDEAFLKRQTLLRLREAILGGGEADFSLSTMPGPTALLADVLEELATLAMFGGKRLVLVEEADEFVTRYRGELEDYTAKPRSGGVLILDTNSWPSNTRLYKAVETMGLQVECSADPKKFPAARMAKWLGGWAKQTHDVQVAAAAIDALIEMIGPELGLLDQELAKLALVAGPGGKVSVEMVHKMVGSWRARTAWEMLDAALDGNVRQAMLQLDRLLLAGENAIALLAQISSSLRRLAAATRLLATYEAKGERMGLREALGQAGVKPFVLEKTERQIKRLGRARAERLYSWLLEADLGMKGASQASPRLLLERLILRIAAPQPGQPPQTSSPAPAGTRSGGHGRA